MERIYSQFVIDGLPISCNRYGSGHINETYLLVTNRPHLYILQKLNSHVFKNVPALMQNVISVTEYLHARDEAPRRALTLVPTIGGEKYLTTADGEYWRMYEFVPDSLCMDQPDNENDLYQS